MNIRYTVREIQIVEQWTNIPDIRLFISALMQTVVIPIFFPRKTCKKILLRFLCVSCCIYCVLLHLRTQKIFNAANQKMMYK